MYYSRTSTASFIALNKRGVKSVSQLHYWQYKTDTASVFKVICFPARSNQLSLKKVVSIENLKQNVGLENN